MSKFSSPAASSRSAASQNASATIALIVVVGLPIESEEPTIRNSNLFPVKANGDGYSKEWEKEAQRRGLPVFPGMIDSVEALTTDKAIRLYERFGIYNRAELESRKEIVYETYVKTIHIEAKTMIDMASKDILPAVIRYTKTLADTIASAQQVGMCIHSLDNAGKHQ